MKPYRLINKRLNKLMMWYLREAEKAGVDAETRERTYYAIRRVMRMVEGKTAKELPIPK